MQLVVLVVFVFMLPALSWLLSVNFGLPYLIWWAVPSIVLGSLLIALIARDWRWLLIDVAATLAVCLGLFVLAMRAPFAETRAIGGQFAIVWGAWIICTGIGTAVSLWLTQPGRFWVAILPRVLGLAAPLVLARVLPINTVLW